MAQQNNLDFNIVAHTKGMEQIALLINRVNALEAETRKLASANAGLASSTDTIVRNGTRYNNALDAQSKQLRNARQGTQQLGMQINDFATSVSTGASVSQAFNQQLGQLGYAMSMMGGTAGKVGAFLAGPWGAAITLAVVALGPFIDRLGQAIMRLFETKSALDEVSRSAANSMQALSNSVRQASLESTAMTDVAKQFAVASREYTKANNELQAAKKMGPMDDADPAAVFAYQRRLESLSRKAQEAKRTMDSFQSRVNQINSISRVKAMQNAASTAQNTAPKISGAGGASSAAASLSPFQKEAQKEAEASARWYSNLQGEYVQEYQGYRTMMTKSDEAWASTLAGIEDDASRNSIDAAAQRAMEIGYISEAIGKKLADEVDAPIKAVQESFVAIGNSVSDAFKGMLTGAMSWKDGMRSIIASVIDELWRLYVVQQIVGMVTSFLGGTTGATAARLAPSATATIAANAPLFANGTVNAPGGMAWVGERGPELVNLPRGSQVIPAHRAQNMGGGGINISVDARGSSDPAAVRAQVEAGILQAAPAIIAAAEARTVAGLRRPRLGGAIK